MNNLEQFCLRYNDFQTNISESFKALRNEGDFADVTLACEDDKQIEAHKVVLSSSSPFFKNILKRNKHEHPLIYLRGVKMSELESVLQYIYLGEVEIEHGSLKDFLSFAEELQLAGLTNKDNSQSKSSISEPYYQDKYACIPHLLSNGAKR